jgi:transketolase
MSILRSDLLDPNAPVGGMRDAYGETLLELGPNNKDMVVLSADLAGSTKVLAFRDKVDEKRFLNMGISEQDMIGTAAGLTLTGKVVFVSTFAIFLTGRCWEQIRQSVCHTRLGVKLVSSHGGVTVGPDGGSHQMCEDIALMRSLPNMNVIMPSCPQETREVIRFIAKDPRPFYVRTSRIPFPLLFTGEYRFRLGKGVVMHRSDQDRLTFIACGLAVKRALLAASILAEEGINARVVNMSSIKPIDRELIAACARETGLLVTVEEHSTIGGLGSAVAETIGETWPCPVVRLGIPDVFGLSGSDKELLEHFGLVPEAIAARAREALSAHNLGAVHQ